MIESVKKKIQLLPSQLQFIRSTKREVLFSGAMRAGKSRVLCYALVKQVLKNPNNTVLLCRRTLKSLKNTTLNTLLRGDNNDPVLPPGSYRHNKMEQFIDVKGGGRINYAGIDNIIKIRSMSLGAIGIDESIEFELEEYTELLGRLSLPAGTRQIYMATNPGVPGNWMHDRFFKNRKETDDMDVIISRTVDNFFLPNDYFETLKLMSESQYKRFALGEWVALENTIYPEFNRDKHIRIRGHGEFIKYMLGVDFGFTNPTAICLIGVDGDNNMHLVEELKRSKLLIGQIVELCEKYHRLEPTVIVDPSAPALIAEFEQAGYTVKKADNSVDSGIARFQNYLHQDKFSCDPSCVEFIKEIENYCYNKDGRPVKINDHLCDSIRYCCSDLVANNTAYQKPQIYFGEDEN